MYKIIDGRGTGKTGRLMLLAKENKGVIACSNPKAMEEKAHRYGIFGIDFISYWNLITAMKDKVTYENIFVDEIDVFIQYMLAEVGTIQGYTLSIED